MTGRGQEAALNRIIHARKTNETLNLPVEYLLAFRCERRQATLFLLGVKEVMVVVLIAVIIVVTIMLRRRL